MIEIVFVPVGNGRFNAKLGDKIIAASTKTPFCSGARALVRGGADFNEVLIGRHQGSETIALKSTVGAASATAVREDDKTGKFTFLKWRPPPVR